ncbi:SAYSvFN domain-containing protein 1 [Drosophila navojoa]|uniref:SAYSvFN domain-containing protein 1 n=1 Tax=Drosophila navojoa TaxID=7232 RepID=UPI00084684B0|nr:SAYSvFN domain-containing protein 1 [Drosophila navojoa]
MADFQEQLRNYRQQKQKEALLSSFKLKLKRFLMLGTGVDPTQGKCQTTIEVKPAPDKSDINDTPEEYASSDDEIEASHRVVNASEGQDNKCLKYTLWTVYFLFWVTLYVIAIELKFGLVFLMFSALLGIYFNTRTGPKDPNEISAYSIFNKNCESIDGTLKAEQFEREIRYGSGSVR